MLKLFFSNLLNPLKLKVPRMVPSNASVFKFTLISRWMYFLLVRNIRPFLHENVVIIQPDACRWFYALIYAKWFPLTQIIVSIPNYNKSSNKLNMKKPYYNWSYCNKLPTQRSIIFVGLLDHQLIFWTRKNLSIKGGTHKLSSACWSLARTLFCINSY